MKLSRLLVALAACCLGIQSAQADLLVDGDFEASAWTTFNNAFQDVDAPGIDPAFEGAQSLKMFGNFFGNPNFSGAFQDIAVDGSNLSVGDLIQLSGYMAHVSGDALGGPNVVSFLEITFVDIDGAHNGGNPLGEFGFGANKTADLLSTDPTDEWLFRTTAGVFVPVEAEFVRAKAVFIQNDTVTGGAAWVDNMSLDLITVPEPSSMGVVLVGAVAGLVYRRRREAKA